MLKKFRTSQIEIKITKLIEELIPLLIGMELYFGVSAQQYVKNLRLPNEEQIVKTLLKAKYIQGTVENWKLSKSVLEAVSHRLATLGDNRSTLTYSASESKSNTNTAPPSIVSMVFAYRRQLKRVPEVHRGQRVTNMFVFFRKLCKQVDAIIVKKQIDRFFKYASAGNNDYRLETFSAYVRSLK